MAPRKNPAAKLYYKGKALNKFYKDAVIKTAQAKRVDISTPEKLKTFYDSNKEKFALLFDIGLETQLSGTTKIFNEWSLAEDNKHPFFMEKDGKKEKTSANRVRFELAKLEHELNVLLGSTGVEYSYKIGMNGDIVASFPDENEIEAIAEEPVDFINDYLSNYGIKIYTSDETKRKKFTKNEPRRKQYSERIEQRLKIFRKEYNKEKRKGKKGKTKRKKR